MGFLCVYGFCMVAYVSRKKAKRKEENKCQQRKWKKRKKKYIKIIDCL